jgi:hypothetical protein
VRGGVDPHGTYRGLRAQEVNERLDPLAASLRSGLHSLAREPNRAARANGFAAHPLRKIDSAEPITAYDATRDLPPPSQRRAEIYYCRIENRGEARTCIGFA